MRIVTALRERPRGRVEIELDGSTWRLAPADAVVRSGLAVGRALDRETARTFARELRRAEALQVAVRALRHRDHSRQRLAERLSGRAGAADALDALERAGLLDDGRVAGSRATGLAGRGFGDAAIRARLEAEGFTGEAVAGALAALEPESARARALLEADAGPRALRRLAAKGFDPSTLEDVAGFADGA
ncbi:MAG TPA: RecX family transcriptional regulator [Gaiellaceae bacterium]|nr:RecX family transcriptional regulator [Gaiellaceae bacterium]